MTEQSDSQSHIRDQFRAEIPLLRRCGRALTGTQNFADICVIQLMDDFVFGRVEIPQGLSLRSSFYRLYLEQLQSFSVEETKKPFSVSFTPTERIAHWLSAGEGFSKETIAEILGVAEAEVSSLLEAARDDMAGDRKARVLIIEDEMFIAMDLARIVRNMGHTVTETARTHQEGMDAFRQQQPDLILSDIQLADGSSGIEAVDEILRIAEIPAIFITSFPERLLTGKRAEPAFLINKPFRTEAVRAAISQALFLKTPVDAVNV